MKLSEAIRLGAMLKPQSYGKSFTGTSSCALQAAADAAGVDQRLLYSNLAERWPFVNGVAACPSCGTSVVGLYDGKIINFIHHLNDIHRWTREAIADWVETLEAAQPAVDPEPAHAEQLVTR